MHELWHGIFTVRCDLVFCGQKKRLMALHFLAWTHESDHHLSKGPSGRGERGGLFWVAVVLILLGGQAGAWAAAQLYSQGDPTDDEQYMLEMINRARANPAAEGLRLAATTDPGVLSAYSFFNVSTSLLISDFASYPARPPLAFNPSLISSARLHSNNMVAQNSQQHQLPGEADPGTRMTNAGYTGWSAAAENIFAYCDSIWYGHAGFQSDWGNYPEIGHRINIMNMTGAIYQEIGIGVVAGPGNGNGVQTGPLVVTQDFGLRNGQYFLLGVVYNRHATSDGFYAPGSGISGVTITLSQGNYYAVTSSSGGYAIPISGLSGNVVVTAQGNGVNEQTTVNLSGQNVKVDFGGGTSLFFQNGASLGVLNLNGAFLPGTWQGIGTMGSGWQERALADINGDGIPDIIFQNGALIGALILDASGNPGSWVGIGSMNAGWQLRGAGEVTGDGKLDLIFQNGTLLGYLEVNTSGVPQSWTGIGAMGTGWQLRAVADLNGDGHPDLLFQNGASLGVLQVGTSGLPTAWNGIGALNAGWTLSDAVDVNGDGEPDLLFQNGTQLGALEVNTSFQPVAWHGIGAMGAGWTLPGDY
jgi:hypothetical protein